MKKNYQKLMEAELNRVDKAGEKPSLLLHSCCGPCSSVALQCLCQYFEVTLLYYNPNIQPKAEFEKRLLAQQKLILAAGHKVKVIAPKYDTNEFLGCALGLQTCPEGGKRCFKCFELRLKKTAKIASSLGQKYFTTTLTTSPHKNAEIINELGLKIAAESQVLFLCADFKKKEGYKRSIELSKKYDIYRQNYCGCLYSLKEAGKN